MGPGHQGGFSKTDQKYFLEFNSEKSAGLAACVAKLKSIQFKTKNVSLDCCECAAYLLFIIYYLSLFIINSVKFTLIRSYYLHLPYTITVVSSSLL